MPFDPFESSTDSLIAPAKEAFSITPDDSSDLPTATKAVYVGNGGDIVIRAVSSSDDVTLRNVPSGSVIAVRLKAVRVTGTTASDLVGLV